MTSKDLLAKDPEYRESLGSLGFCLMPLLNGDQVGQIAEVYKKYFHGNEFSGLIATHSQMSAEKSIAVSHALAEITMPSLDGAFENFEYFVGGFMVKKANTQGELTLHNDWNLVDETQYASYHIWIPLEMSHRQNGGMIVLPCSHNFFSNMRSGSYGIPDITREEKLKQYCTDMNIVPGMGLVFHDALFHASYPNNSNIDRVAAVITIRDKRSKPLYYHKNTKENRTEIYTIDADIFLRNLNVLESGLPPNDFFGVAHDPISDFDTRSLSVADLVEKFEEVTKINEAGFEPFQLHILRDKKTEQALWRQGYAVIDFLDWDTADRLLTKYEDNFANVKSETGRFSTLENMSYEERKFYHDYILSEITPALDRCFSNYEVPCASYFTKLAHSAGVLTWHTDASLLLNAHLEPHYALWCPLLDVDARNGALCVIERSHRFSNTQYLYTLPYPFDSIYDEFDSASKVLNLRKGQAVIFDIRLVHNATPNETGKDRVCFSLRLTHPKSAYYSFLAEGNDKWRVGIYEEGKSHYLNEEWDDNSLTREPRKKVGELFDIHRDIDLGKITSMLRSRGTS